MNNGQKSKPKFNWNGDTAVTLYFDEQISESLTRKILSLTEVFKKTFSKKLKDVIPAYQSLTLCFDVSVLDIKEIEKKITQVVNEDHVSSSKSIKSNLIDIPVCYAKAYAPDLKTLADACRLSVDQVIQLHTQESYLVNMLGFLPGFLYLSGLNKQIHCPRKRTPSLKVSAGAVGIGGGQTGIYPIDSPGGWHIIGSTPVSLFSPTEDEPFFAKPLDRVRFIAIDENEYQRLKQKTYES